MKVLDPPDSDTSSWDAVPADAKRARNLTRVTLETVPSPWASVRSPWASEEFVRRAMRLVPAATPRSPVADASPAAQLFKELADTWGRETRMESFVHRIAMHPAYQRIIGLGAPAVGLILERLREGPGHWFWALHAITGEDPAAGLSNLSEARAAWLQWGVEHGYLPPLDP
jgi:hypothetical protein